MTRNSDQTPVQNLIAAAMQALKDGDRLAARRYAEQAAAAAPQNEEPWLLLAFLASPRAAQYYLDRALQANPTSQRVLAAQTWLKTQPTPGAAPAGADLPPIPGLTEPPPSIASAGSELQAPPDLTEPLPSAAEPAGAELQAAPGLPEPAPSAAGAGADLEAAPGVSERSPSASPLRHLLRYALMLVVAVAVVVGLINLDSAARTAESQDDALVRIVQTVLNSAPIEIPSPTPSLTWTASPTVTATATATSTPPPTSTHTASPTPTSTSTPTATSTPTSTNTPTALPTETPLPSPTRPQNTPVVNTSYKVVPGDTLSKIAQRYEVSVQSLIAANNLANPSLIHAGQVITIPAPGTVPASQPTAASAPGGSNGGGKRILIDISEQRTYAYENDKLVFNFVASTGIGNSTRIGTFKVLDKIPNAYSNAFNIWMPYWMGIYYSGTLENGIHGLPKLWNGVELWGNLLGRPATYGCIESKTSEAKQLYDWAEIGIPVVIQR